MDEGIFIADDCYYEYSGYGEIGTFDKKRVYIYARQLPSTSYVWVSYWSIADSLWHTTFLTDEATDENNGKAGTHACTPGGIVFVNGAEDYRPGFTEACVYEAGASPPVT